MKIKEGHFHGPEEIRVKLLFSPTSPVYETSPLFSKSPSIAQSLTSGDNLTPGNADSMPSPIESEDLELPTHSVQSTRKGSILIKKMLKKQNLTSAKVERTRKQKRPRTRQSSSNKRLLALQTIVIQTRTRIQTQACLAMILIMRRVSQLGNQLATVT